MELILTLVVVAVIGFVLYKQFGPKLDTNKDGKIDQAEVKAAVEEVKVAAKKTKAAVKKATTRKPKAK